MTFNNKKSLKYLKGFLILISAAVLLVTGYYKLQTNLIAKPTNRSVVLSSKMTEVDKKQKLEGQLKNQKSFPTDSNVRSEGLNDKSVVPEKNIPEKCSESYINESLVTECYQADVLKKRIKEETLPDGIIIITSNYRKDGSLISRSIVEEGTDDELHSYMEYDRQGRVVLTEISKIANGSDIISFRQSQIKYKGDIKIVNVSGTTQDDSSYESEMIFKSGKPIHLEYQDHNGFRKRIFDNQGNIIERIEYSLNSFGEIEGYTEFIYDYLNSKLSAISSFDEYGSIKSFKEIDVYEGGSSIIRLYHSRYRSENLNPDEIIISGGANTTKLMVNPASGIIVNQSESSALGKSWVGYGWQDVYDLAEINPETVFKN